MKWQRERQQAGTLRPHFYVCDKFGKRKNFLMKLHQNNRKTKWEMPALVGISRSFHVSSTLGTEVLQQLCDSSWELLVLSIFSVIF